MLLLNPWPSFPQRFWAFSFSLLNKSLMQEFCAHLHQGKHIFQSNTNSVHFSLRLVCVHKRKKLKKSPLQKSTKIDAHTLYTSQHNSRSFKNERFFQINEEKTLDLSKFAPIQSQHPPSVRRRRSLGLNKGTTERRFLHVGSRDANP